MADHWMQKAFAHNKGSFTRSAAKHGEGVQEYAHEVAGNPRASTRDKRRANLAILAKKLAHKR